jgi:hypothetical protein
MKIDLRLGPYVMAPYHFPTVRAEHIDRVLSSINKRLNTVATPQSSTNLYPPEQGTALNDTGTIKSHHRPEPPAQQSPYLLDS